MIFDRSFARSTRRRNGQPRAAAGFVAVLLVPFGAEPTTSDA
jgi:hypothetical protein